MFVDLGWSGTPPRGYEGIGYYCTIPLHVYLWFHEGLKFMHTKCTRFLLLSMCIHVLCIFMLQETLWALVWGHMHEMAFKCKWLCWEFDNWSPHVHFNGVTPRCNVHWSYHSYENILTQLLFNISIAKVKAKVVGMHSKNLLCFVFCVVCFSFSFSFSHAPAMSLETWV